MWDHVIFSQFLVFECWLELWLSCCYADDIVVHTVSEEAAAYILRLMRERFRRCGLTLHPEKTKLVCTDLRKDVGCKRDCITSFTFLGHKFHRKMVRVRKQSTVQLLYQVSIADKSRKRMLEELKALQLHRRTLSLEGIVMLLKVKVRGWVAYYGKYARTAMHRIYAHINYRLVKWCMCKYRKFKDAALRWLRKRWERHSQMCVHWQQTPWFCYPFKGEQIRR